MNEFVFVLHTVTSFAEIWYEGCAHNAVELCELLKKIGIGMAVPVLYV